MAEVWQRCGRGWRSLTVCVSSAKSGLDIAGPVHRAGRRAGFRHRPPAGRHVRAGCAPTPIWRPLHQVAAREDAPQRGKEPPLPTAGDRLRPDQATQAPETPDAAARWGARLGGHGARRSACLRWSARGAGQPHAESDGPDGRATEPAHFDGARRQDTPGSRGRGDTARVPAGGGAVARAVRRRPDWD